MGSIFQRDKDSYFLDQSARDVPCRVRFAGEDSLISLSKWDGRATLNFRMGQEQGGSLLVKRNEILLKPDANKKAHHVFRKLDGENFEYDVILLKEPETNVIDIDLEFPDGLEFYRQPSFEDVLAKRSWCPSEVIDSYAVYWKERNGIFKTGKFCHIYRPLIYDARGRKVWGRLLLSGKKLTITIPEDWLADASYPVVVDPIVGTQTRGATKTVDWYGEGESQDFYIELGMALNSFSASSPISGTCTSYLYSYLNDSELQGQAALFSSSGGIPSTRLSRNETVANLARSTAGWVSSTFTLSRTISAGEPFWYGYNTPSTFFTYVDFANTMRKMNTDSYSGVPDTYIDNGENFDFLMSMYFSYTDAQSYSRTILDTIGISEALLRRLAGMRLCSASVGVTESKSIQRSLLRGCTSISGMSDANVVSRFLFRWCVSITGMADNLLRTICSFRIVTSACSCIRGLAQSVTHSRLVQSVAGFAEALFRSVGINRECAETTIVTENISFQRILVRLFSDDLSVNERFSMVQTLIRNCISGLDMASLFGRSLGFFRTVASGCTFIENILKRMILKKDEIVFVSRITREIEFKGGLV